MSTKSCPCRWWSGALIDFRGFKSDSFTTHARILPRQQFFFVRRRIHRCLPGALGCGENRQIDLLFCGFMTQNEAKDAYAPLPGDVRAGINDTQIQTYGRVVFAVPSTRVDLLRGLISELFAVIPIIAFKMHPQSVVDYNTTIPDGRLVSDGRVPCRTNFSPQATNCPLCTHTLFTPDLAPPARQGHRKKSVHKKATVFLVGETTAVIRSMTDRRTRPPFANNFLLSHKVAKLAYR